MILIELQSNQKGNFQIKLNEFPTSFHVISQDETTTTIAIEINSKKIFNLFTDFVSELKNYTIHHNEKVVKEITKENLKEKIAKITNEEFDPEFGIVQHKPVKSLKQFMDVLNKKKEEFMENRKLSPIKNDCFLFRGMCSDNFKIVGRIKFDIKYHIRKEFPEGSYDSVEDVEKEMLNGFMQKARIYQNIEPQDDWEWIALARHHNVPTRILDWSTDPLIALWFAVQDEKAYMHEPSVVCIFYPDKKMKIHNGRKIFDIESEKNQHSFQNSESNTVNADKPIDNSEESKKAKGDGDNPNDILNYNVKFENFISPFSIDYLENPEVILYKPSSLNYRIDSQSSWFTIHPFVREKHNGKLTKKGEYLELDPEGKDKDQFSKIYIASDQTHEIRKELGALGIDIATIYKDLDHTGKFFKEKYFKLSDEIYSDQGFLPENVLKTFQQLQGIVGLYHPDEVEKLNYMNLKGAYNKLIGLLSDESKPIKSLLTFNNMNREILSYRNERELFLRLIEKGMDNKVNKLIYKRIQYYNVAKGFKANKNKTEHFDPFCKRKLFENIMIWTDGLSKAHIQNCEDKKPGTTKYLLINDKGFNLPCFCIVEDFKGNSHLLLEFNNEYLPFVGEMQNMFFWLELKNNSVFKSKESTIIMKFKQAFAENFRRENLSYNKNEKTEIYKPNDSYWLHNFEDAKNIIEEQKEIFKNMGNPGGPPLSDDYVRINYDKWILREGLKENENEERSALPSGQVNHNEIKSKKKRILYYKNEKYFKTTKCLFIPVFDCNDRLPNIHSLLDYIFYKLRGNHPITPLRDFSYGDKKEWYLKNEKGEILKWEDDKDSFTGRTEEQLQRKTYYKRYFYHEKLEDNESCEVKGGETYRVKMGREFLNRLKQLKKVNPLLIFDKFLEEYKEQGDFSFKSSEELKQLQSLFKISNKENIIYIIFKIIQREEKLIYIGNFENAEELLEKFFIKIQHNEVEKLKFYWWEINDAKSPKLLEEKKQTLISIYYNEFGKPPEGNKEEYSS